jgi:hypothetical protein
MAHNEPAKVLAEWGSSAVSSPVLTACVNAQVCGNGVFLLGQLSANPYLADSTANRFGSFGSPYSPTSINNPYIQYGSPYCLARSRESRHCVAAFHKQATERPPSRLVRP